MIVVRRADIDDVEDALFLARRMHVESPLHCDYNYSQAKVEQLIECAIATEEWLPLLAYKGGKPIGMALMVVAETFYGGDKECTDLVFYVDPTERGGRCALKMVQFIEWWSSDKDAKRIMIGVHNGINHDQASSFFTKLGYRAQGIVMEKSVH